MINTIIFDLIGVLLESQKLKLIHRIGIGSCLRYIIKHRKNPLTESLKILDLMRRQVPGQYQDTIAYRGVFLPNCICLWQQGLIFSTQAAQEIKNFVTQLADQGYFKDKKDEEFVIKLSHYFVNDSLGYELLHLVSTMPQFIAQLKEKNIKLYILSNIDNQTFSELYQRYQIFFDTFDGIVTSGKTKLLKPYPDIYKYLVEHYQLTASECLFIDDQVENLATAQKLGIQTFLCKNPYKLPKEIHTFIRKNNF